MTDIVNSIVERPASSNTVWHANRRIGIAVFAFGSIFLLATFAVQLIHVLNLSSLGFSNWRPVLYAFLVWAIGLGVSQVMIRGEAGQRALFVLPAVLFTVAVVIFPTVFGLFLAFTNWNLSSEVGPQFNGLDNFFQLMGDPYFWNALSNMGFYLAAVLVQYILAFSLALLLNAEIAARKFFRVVFLLPFMLSPVAVSWMIGRSLMDYRTGPVTHVMKALG